MQSKKSTESHDQKIEHHDADDALGPDASFFDKPKNVKLILNSFYAVCLVLVLLDFVVHRHIYLPFEKIPAFYAIYGFIACVLLVVLAKLMRLVLMRGEHYYDERLDESQTVDNENLMEENDNNNMDDLGLKSNTSAGDKK